MIVGVWGDIGMEGGIGLKLLIEMIFLGPTTTKIICRQKMLKLDFKQKLTSKTCR